MYYFGDLTFAQESNPNEPNMTNCERCGFPCNRDTDPVCPLCEQTSRDTDYTKLKIK